MTNLAYIDAMTEGVEITEIEFFSPLWEIMAGLRRKIEDRFELEADPGVKDVESYEAETGAVGALRCFAGPEVDWLCHAWAGVPDRGFAAAQLAVYLSASSKVPNFVFQVATMPFVYIDMPARSDLTIDMATMDRFYSPYNEEYLEDRKRPGLEWFVSPRTALRSIDTPNAITAWLRDPAIAMETVDELANRQLDRWLSWVDAEDAPVVPAELVEQQAADDLARRINAIERDSMGDEVLGTDLRKKVMAAMTSEARSLPRAHQF